MVVSKAICPKPIPSDLLLLQSKSGGFCAISRLDSQSEDYFYKETEFFGKNSVSPFLKSACNLTRLQFQCLSRKNPIQFTQEEIYVR
jgi:hypothetical protein